MTHRTEQDDEAAGEIKRLQDIIRTTRRTLWVVCYDNISGEEGLAKKVGWDKQTDRLLVRGAAFEESF